MSCALHAMQCMFVSSFIFARICLLISLCCVAGKGIVGWTASSEPAGKKSSAKASPAKAAGADRDVKVVLGNKQMMADEGVAISKAVDDYMRDMEVSRLSRASHQCMP